MRNRLDLPFPLGIKAYVYDNQAAFVETCQDRRREPDLVWVERISYGLYLWCSRLRSNRQQTENFETISGEDR